MKKRIFSIKLYFYEYEYSFNHSIIPSFIHSISYSTAYGYTQKEEDEKLCPQNDEMIKM